MPKLPVDLADFAELPALTANIPPVILRFLHI